MVVPDRGLTQAAPHLVIPSFEHPWVLAHTLVEQVWVWVGFIRGGGSDLALCPGRWRGGGEGGSGGRAEEIGPGAIVPELLEQLPVRGG